MRPAAPCMINIPANEQCINFALADAIGNEIKATAACGAGLFAILVSVATGTAAAAATVIGDAAVVACTFAQVGVIAQFLIDALKCDAKFLCDGPLKASDEDFDLDPKLSQLRGIFSDISELVRPFLSAGSAVPAEVQDTIDALVAEADEVAGGDVLEFLRISQLEAERATLAADAQGRVGNAPNFPIKFAARLVAAGDTSLVIRGETEPFGRYRLLVARGMDLPFVALYDRTTDGFGLTFPFSTPGTKYRLSPVTLVPTEEFGFSDVDNDDLPDPVELIYGTNPTNPDTDGDGVRDGAEVRNGTDPLGGRPTRTGVIGAVQTPGVATDVCATGNTAALALGEAGVAILDVSVVTEPRITAIVNTPGSAVRVACSVELPPSVLVADDTGGLAVIDIQDPPLASIVRQVALPGRASSVTRQGPIAYVGTLSGDVFAIDVTTGARLDTLSLGGQVHDLALSGESLLVVQANRLVVAEALPGFPRRQGEVPLGLTPDGNTGRRRISTGDGLAYVTAFPGFDTINVTIPASPRIVGAVQDSVLFNSFKQIVPTGSGLAVAATGVRGVNDGTQHVSVYDVSDPTVTTAFVTQIETPGITHAVTLHEGFAYAADGPNGLQVVNFLPFDTGTTPPTLELDASFSLEPPEAEEGKLLRVTARARDDAQVRRVSFFVDGQLVGVDGSFPFEVRFLAPILTETVESFTLEVRAMDTGGNETRLGPLTIALKDDLTAPRVVRLDPPDAASLFADVSAVTAWFDEPIDPESVGERFTLRDAQGQPVAASVHLQADPAGLLMTFDAPLPTGAYSGQIAAGVKDRAGNALGEVSWTFEVQGLTEFCEGGAQVLLLPPQPYLTRDDSPLALCELAYLHLEDFEDNTFSTPGVSASNGDVFPGPDIDSVDGDDGVVDGRGGRGHSFHGDGTLGINFTFDPVVLGGLPTHAGLVWTDGDPNGEVSFEAFGPDGASLGVLGGLRIADFSFQGRTAEDRLFMAVHRDGISAIRVSSRPFGGSANRGMEIDHLQYGRAVLE